MHIIDELQSTLEEVSYDDSNKISMVENQLKVCSFDQVKMWYVRNKIPCAKPNPKSNDALFFDNNGGCFIEFKNGRITNEVNYEINKKIYDSLFILFDLKYKDKKGNLVDSISYSRENMSYILVYNENNYSDSEQTKQTKAGIARQREISLSPHRAKLYGSVRKLAKEEFILFGLDQFKNYLFKNVYTYTQKEFEESLSLKLSGSDR